VDAPLPLVINITAEAPVPPPPVSGDTQPTFVVSSLVPLNTLSGAPTAPDARPGPVSVSVIEPGRAQPVGVITAPAPTDVSIGSRFLESTDNGFPAVRSTDGTVTIRPAPAAASSDGGALDVLNGIPDTTSLGDGVSFSVPRDAFVHTDAKAVVKLQARQVDGQPLPPWLMFDGITGLFNGRPADGSMPTLQLEVVARDDSGHQARTTFTIAGDAAARSTVAPALDSSFVGFPAVRMTPRELGITSTSSADMLVRFQPIQDQSFVATRGLSFSIPGDAFAHTNPTAVVRLEARQISGDALPPWMTFDGATGRLSGTPPDDFEGVLQIRITARDNQGLEASTQFTITVGQTGALLIKPPAEKDQAAAKQAKDARDAADADAQAPAGDEKEAGDQGDGKDKPNAGKARKGDEVSKAAKQPAKRGAARFADQIRAAREQSPGKTDQALLSSALDKPAKRTPNGRGG
jgi:hypothetical protein